MPCSKRIAIVLVALLALAGRAGAQTPAADAEQLFREGKRLMGARQVAEACEAFAGSFRKDPLVSTLLNLANCREENHQYASAWGHFVEAARMSAEEPALQQVAKERAAHLEWSLSYLIISVPDEARVEGLTITRNGAVVDVAEWNRDMPVDGGTYTITAKAPIYEAWSTTVTVAEARDKQSVTVPRFREVAGGGRAGMPVRRKLAIGAWVAGAAGLSGGLALELAARGAYEDAKAATDNPTRDERYDTANRRRLYGTIVAGAGVALVGAGVYLWITGRRAERRSVTIAPLVGGGAAVGVSAAW